MVAATIAHQSSDVIDRPFGLDTVEHCQRFVKENVSIGIAQIKPSELKYWAPDLVGNEEALFDPEVSIRVLSLKLAYAENLLKEDPRYNDIGVTDRYMLLAIAQNCSSPTQMENIFNAFVENDMRWDKTLANHPGWTGNLRSFVIHMEWLLANGYELPEGVDFDYWKEQAFSDIEGVDY